MKTKIPYEIFVAIANDDLDTFLSIIKKHNLDINTNLRDADLDFSTCEIEDIENYFPENDKYERLYLFIDYAIIKKAYKICKYIAGTKDHKLTSCAFGSLHYAIQTNSIRIFNVIWQAYEDDWEVEGSAVYFSVASNNNLKIFRYLAEKKKLPLENIPCIYENIVFSKAYKIARYLYKKFNIKPVTNTDFKTFFDGRYYKTYKDMVDKFK